MIDSRVATVVTQAAGSSIGAFLARQAQERLLRHILGFRDAAEHPVGHAEAVPSQLLQLAIAHQCLLPRNLSHHSLTTDRTCL